VPKEIICHRVNLVCAFLTICLSCQLMDAHAVAAASQYFIKFATVAPEGSTWLKHMRALDDTIRAKSGGKMGFRIYAGGVAGDELDVLKKIRINQIHSAAFSGVGFGQILPEVRVLDLPFLFRDYEETDIVHRELELFFEEKFREKDFELLAWAEVGNVHLFSKKPIRRIQDLSGLKVWTWSGDPIAKATFSLMGINPIPLSYPDVTTALNTGMIDTVYAPPLAALALQWYTSLNYMTELPLAHSTGAVLMSSKYFHTLPRDLAGLLRSSLKAAMEDLTAALRRQNQETMHLIGESGIEVIPIPSGNELREFYMIHNRVARDLAGTVFPRQTLDRVYEILKKPRQQFP
jgi:TRAP-type C4-dicarboxylate transport system substrate-binding protein